MKASRSSKNRTTPVRPNGKAVRTAPKIPAKWMPFLRKLTAIREDMLSQSRSLLEASQRPVETKGTHIADAASDECDRDLQLGLLSAEQNSLSEIEAAMQRIVSGTYGRCEATGRAIPLERLRAIPWTRFSAEAEAERERRRGLPTPRATPPPKSPRASTAKPAKAPPRKKAAAPRTRRKRAAS